MRINFKLVRTGVIEGRVLDAEGEGQANATVVALPSGGIGNAGSPIIWTATARESSPRIASSRAPTTCGRAGARCWCSRPRRSRSARPAGTRRSSCTLSAPRRARARTHRHPRRHSAGAGGAGGAVRPVAAGAAAQGGRRHRPATAPSRSARCCRGATRSRCASGTRVLSIVSGPREVEMPIEPGATVDLPEHDRGAGRRPRSDRGDAAVSAGRACERGSRPGCGGSRSRTR